MIAGERTDPASVLRAEKAIIAQQTIPQIRLGVCEHELGEKSGMRPRRSTIEKK